MNRPGQKGFRSPATKRAAREAVKAAKEAANNDEVCAAFLIPYLQADTLSTSYLRIQCHRTID